MGISVRLCLAVCLRAYESISAKVSANIIFLNIEGLKE